MSYQVLARKYRPKNFETLVGQEHVVRALTHALHSGRLHHAYLFTGTRGVGKTTLSRILAKALNCIGPDGTGGITAQPCGVCEACTAIDAGRFVDYIEMDAASNRGVDEMAQLLEQAVYAPSNARFKVYMIDEVHMLTNHAFNSMLKTLEEPPEHVKFILATTDPQKIPVTVLSRCLQFNLKQMPPGHIISHLDNILGQEGIDFEQPALRLLAQGAHGSMRDALSLTDQAIAYAAGAVTLDAVQGMLGALDQSYLVRLLDALAQQDGADLLAVADEMASRSLSYNGALQDLGTLLHRIALAQTVPAALPQDLPEYADIVRLSAAFDAEEVQLFYQIAVHGRNELGLAPDEYAGFTMTLLRMLAFRPGIGGADGVPAAAPASAPGNRPAAVAAARAAAGASAPTARAATNSVASHATVTPPAVVAAAAASMARSAAPPPRVAAPAPAPVPAPAPAAPAAAAAPAASGAPISSARAAINAALEAARAASKGRPGSAPSAPSSAPKPAAPAPVAVPEPVAAAPAPAASVQAAPPPPAAAKAPAPWDDAPPVAVMGAPVAAPAPAPAPVQPARQAAPQQAPADDDLPPWVTEFSDDSASAAVSAPAAQNSEQPAVVMPQRAAKQAAPSGPYVITPVPGLDWDGNWPAVAAVLPLRGVAQQLAVQAELIECLHDGHSTTFRLRVPIDTWRSPANVEKLAAALTERFGRKVAVDTELGAVWYTASAEAQAHREACQLQAEATIASDPFVLDMKRAFDAFVVPGTITPAPAGSAAPTLH
ncbi:MAG: DNA polymerase III subunit gamma/tau [Janthinobacterium svalbardensis]|uniref:DNA polymerase III subunit gamma/tau n=1 Tax=Janthinobacterium svalbardensis TaxID=368607 RepID=A0A290WU07_9BURK|nr:DNA polymerase III subunit gamma/tau [Janthinobacterium svalbardensis]ATD60377.1 DNA polymerase III subunit gamma/tau [Janthinobacterium svalbardensis]